MQKLPSVLLVDDDSTSNFLNERLLLSLGVTDQVLVATNGERALTLLAQACAPVGSLPACPVLILLDVRMPIMDGIEFLEAYQPAPPAPPIRIVVLTSSTNPGDLARLELLPVVGLINKPLTREKVATILQEHFQRQLPAH